MVDDHLSGQAGDDLLLLHQLPGAHVQLHVPAQVADPVAQGLAHVKGDHGVVGVPHAEAQAPDAALVQLLQFFVADLVGDHGDAPGALGAKLLDGVQQAGVVRGKGLGLDEHRPLQSQLVGQLGIGLHRADLGGGLPVVGKGRVDDVQVGVAGAGDSQLLMYAHANFLRITPSCWAAR